MTILVGKENYLKTDLWNSVSVTSENPLFPSANLWNNKRRTKVWRSAGHWVVDDTNNTIVWNEGGSDFTSELGNGVYTSDAAFLAHVVSKFENASASDYTLVRDPVSKLLTITSTAATFNIKWSHVNTTAADLLGWHEVDDTGSQSYTSDLVRIHSYEAFEWDFGIPTNPKGFFIGDQKNTPIGLSGSAVLKLQGNGTNNWTSPEYEADLEYDGNYIFKTSPTGLHTEGLRYWRFYIEDRTNTNVYIQLGSMYLGDMIVGTRGSVQFPLQSEMIDFSNSVTVESGAVISEKKNQTIRYGLEWFGLTVAERESIDASFKEFGTALPFYVHLDPGEAYSTDGRVHLVKYINPTKWVLESPGNFSASMQIREEL